MTTAVAVIPGDVTIDSTGRTVEDISADLIVEVARVLEGTVWAAPFADLTQPHR